MSRLPHTRGGEPLSWTWRPTDRAVFPTRVGVNQRIIDLATGQTVFPTRVGVNRWKRKSR